MIRRELAWAAVVASALMGTIIGNYVGSVAFVPVNCWCLPSNRHPVVDISAQ